MKAIAFANRLCRHLPGRSLDETAADARQDILDAINAALQELHSFAPDHSKVTKVTMSAPAPEIVSLTVTDGSDEFTGREFISSEFYRTIRIDGDAIDNQVVGPGRLLHPYSGTSGTVSATVYGDAIPIPEPYEQMFGDPEILETGHFLTHIRPPADRFQIQRQVRRPLSYHIEANARNRNPESPAVLRLDSLPDASYRLHSSFIMAPARMTFADLLAPGADIPLRAEHVELYLLPIAISKLAQSSTFWADPSTRATMIAAGKQAAADYSDRVNDHLATPRARVRTKPGF